MIALWGLAVASLQKAQRQDSLIRALTDANAERDLVVKLYTLEIVKLQAINQRLADDNALTVEAVTEWPIYCDLVRATPPKIH